MASSKSNPNAIGVENEYAGFKAPKRPDASTITYYGSNPGGNRVDRADIPKTLGRSGAVSKAKPLGAPESRGY